MKRTVCRPRGMNDWPMAIRQATTTIRLTTIQDLTGPAPANPAFH